MRELVKSLSLLYSKHKIYFVICLFPKIDKDNIFLLSAELPYPTAPLEYCLYPCRRNVLPITVILYFLGGDDFDLDDYSPPLSLLICISLLIFKTKENFVYHITEASFFTSGDELQS